MNIRSFLKSWFAGKIVFILLFLFGNSRAAGAIVIDLDAVDRLHQSQAGHADQIELVTLVQRGFSDKAFDWTIWSYSNRSKPRRAGCAGPARSLRRAARARSASSGSTPYSRRLGERG